MPPSQGVQERAFAETVKAAALGPEFSALISVGRRLSQLIDLERGEEGESAVVVKLATEYRLVLTALGLTVTARMPKGGGSVHDLPVNPLRAARDAARKRRAAAGDAPAS